MSEHAAPALKPADDPTFKLPASLSGLQMPLLGGGLIALVVGLGLGFMTQSSVEEMPRFGMSVYLTAFLYVLTIVLGALFFVLIQHLSRAGWSVVVRRVAEFMMLMVLPMAVLFIRSSCRSSWAVLCSFGQTQATGRTTILPKRS